MPNSAERIKLALIQLSTVLEVSGDIPQEYLDFAIKTYSALQLAINKAKVVKELNALNVRIAAMDIDPFDRPLPVKLNSNPQYNLDRDIGGLDLFTNDPHISNFLSNLSSNATPSKPRYDIDITSPLGKCVTLANMFSLRDERIWSSRFRNFRYGFDYEPGHLTCEDTKWKPDWKIKGYKRPKSKSEPSDLILKLTKRVKV